MAAMQDLKKEFNPNHYDGLSIDEFTGKSGVVNLGNGRIFSVLRAEGMTLALAPWFWTVFGTDLLREDWGW